VIGYGAIGLSIVFIPTQIIKSFCVLARTE
jgi:hypothetical protein